MSVGRQEDSGSDRYVVSPEEGQGIPKFNESDSTQDEEEPEQRCAQVFFFSSLIF